VQTAVAGMHAALSPAHSPQCPIRTRERAKQAALDDDAPTDNRSANWSLFNSVVC
jgi:hypothetical protein